MPELLTKRRPVLPSTKIHWKGWLKRIATLKNKWKRQYFVLVEFNDGSREFRYFDAPKDPHNNNPKGIMELDSASGICYLDNTKITPGVLPKHNVLKGEFSSGTPTGADPLDHKFTIVCPETVALLAFAHGGEWESTSESQQGLNLLATLSTMFPPIEVLHSGWMSKKREKTNHANRIVSFWKWHFFVYLANGSLLYFSDECFSLLQGQVDVRLASTVRVSGQQFLSSDRKPARTNISNAGESSSDYLDFDACCVVWIATPLSKMFVIRVFDSEFDSDTPRHDAIVGEAKKWLALLLQGHAQTKYKQLEKCARENNYRRTDEALSAIRAGIPEDLRGALWKGFSGANSTECNYKNLIKDDVCKDELLLSQRLGALSIYNSLCSKVDDNNFVSSNPPPRLKRSTACISQDLLSRGLVVDNSIPCRDSAEKAARRRVLIALTRNKSHPPVSWKTICLLTAYMDEESAFQVIQTIVNRILPGYFHGQRPALRIDTAVVIALLSNRMPKLYAHLRHINFDIEKTVGTWFLNLFTSGTSFPLCTVLRILDAFFVRGVTILFGVAIAIFLKAETLLKDCEDGESCMEIIHNVTQDVVDIGPSLYSIVFSADLSLLFIKDEQLEKLRRVHRGKVQSKLKLQIAKTSKRLDILRSLKEFSTSVTLLKFVQSMKAIQRELESSLCSVSLELQSTIEIMIPTMQEHLKLIVLSVGEFIDGYQRRLSAHTNLSSQLKSCPVSVVGTMSSDLLNSKRQVQDGREKYDGVSTEKNPLFQVLKNSELFFLDGMDRSFVFPNLSLLQSRLLIVGRGLCAVTLACNSEYCRFKWHGDTWLLHFEGRTEDLDYNLNDGEHQQSIGINVANRGSDEMLPFANNESRNRSVSMAQYRGMASKLKNEREKFYEAAVQMSKHLKLLQKIEGVVDDDALNLLIKDIQLTENQIRGPAFLRSDDALDD